MAASVALQALVAMGGMAALSWEVLWQIEASLALGVSAQATAITLAATMAGMAIGAIGFGRVLRNRTLDHPARVYGLLEFVIGLSGLYMLSGFRLLEGLDAWMYAQSPPLAPVLHAAGIVLLLGPPTLAMGATVPIFELLARRHETSLSRLYGINVAGAALGVVLLAFFILPALGIRQTCIAISMVNLLVFAITQVLPAGEDSPATLPGVHPSGPRHFSAPLAAFVVFCTGTATFGLEVAWFRSFRAAFQDAADSFAIILASVLIPLAIGARLVSRIRRRGVGPGTLLGGAGVLILLATPLVERVDMFALYLPFRTEGPEYYPLLLGVRLILALAILGPAILFLGTLLPWLLDEFCEPELAGRLYAINTAGAVCGSLLTAWVLLPWLGAARTAWILGALIVAVAVVVSKNRRALVAFAGAMALGLAVMLTSSLGRDRVQLQYDWKGYRILAYDEGPDSTVTVIQTAKGFRFLVIDGFGASVENMNSAVYMEWMGRLPMVLHPDPKRALVICFGTGQTTHAVRDEQPHALDVVDVSRAVFAAAPHFQSNHEVLRDPRVHSIVMDGRAWLRRTNHLYDVVTLEPMPPHFAGVNALYSKEFYEIVSERLNPGGVVAQWLPLHLLPPYYAASVAATFHHVFADSVLWIDPFGTGILVGRRGRSAQPLTSEWPGLTRDVLGRSMRRDDVIKAVALLPDGLSRYAKRGDIITDDNQLLTYGRIRPQKMIRLAQALTMRNFEDIRRARQGR